MATSTDFIDFVCDQIAPCGEVSCRKMFGEYMIYVNTKPILLVCDNMVFVKKLEPVAELFKEAQSGFPYKGAKEHHILDIDNTALSRKVVLLLEKITPLPKPKKVKKLHAMI